MNSGSSAWNVEGVEDRAVALYKEGWSASAIAKTLFLEFKVNISRNGVIGKMHRLGVNARAAPSKPRAVAKPKADPRMRRPAVHDRPAPVHRNQTPPPKQADPAPYQARVMPTGEKSVGLLELGSCMCKWPVGEALGRDQMFCGEVYTPTKGRPPYCDYHFLGEGDFPGAISAAWKAKKAQGKHTAGELVRSPRRLA